MATNLLPPTTYHLLTILAIPLGIILAKTTADEKQIYTKYFPPILIALAILIIISAVAPTTHHLPPTSYFVFIFITTLVWHKS